MNCARLRYFKPTQQTNESTFATAIIADHGNIRALFNAKGNIKKGRFITLRIFKTKIFNCYYAQLFFYTIKNQLLLQLYQFPDQAQVLELALDQVLALVLELAPVLVLEQE